MLYKLLGWVVWQLGKRYLRRKLSAPSAPALVGAVAVAAAIVAAAVTAARHEAAAAPDA
jgi:H+/Cl- antiporter ClcA